MSGSTPPGADAPFGYTFDTSSQADSSYPPPGPPLLDNNESSLLDSFFNNPNDINPMFLSLPTDFQSDSANLFGNAPLDWSSQGSVSSIPANPNSMLPNLGQSSSQHSQNRHIPASADVYAAAGILHNSNNNNNNSTSVNNSSNNPSTNRQDNPANFEGYRYNVAPNPAANGLQINGFGLGSLQANQVSEYNLSEGNSNIYNGYQDPTHPYGPGVQNRSRGQNRNRPAAPLNFGSDDNFRDNAYAAPTTELPDKHLVEAVDHNFGQDSDGSRRWPKDGSSQGQASNRKRRRQTSQLPQGKVGTGSDNVNEPHIAEVPPLGRYTLKEEGNDDNDDDDDDDRNYNDQHDGEDDNDDDYTQLNIARRGKKKLNPNSAASKTAASSVSGQTKLLTGSPLPSPSKKAKTGPVGLLKERRENLTEQQKRSNHILSEQKRRNLIKQGFEDLNRMVPELRSSGLSKSNMLIEAARFMRKVRDENDELRQQLESLDNG